MKNSLALLRDALMIAWDVHMEQRDKAGDPYMYHVLRVVSSVTGVEERIIAALHDVLEDGGDYGRDRVATLDLGMFQRESLDAITKRKGENYGDYIMRVALDPIAAKVKLADLIDNMNRDRIKAPTAEDCARWSKYSNAYWWLSTYHLQREFTLGPNCEAIKRVQS